MDKTLKTFIKDNNLSDEDIMTALKANMESAENQGAEEQENPDEEPAEEVVAAEEQQDEEEEEESLDDKISRLVDAKLAALKGGKPKSKTKKVKAKKRVVSVIPPEFGSL